MPELISRQEELKSQKSFIIFENAIKSKATRNGYVRDLFKFLEFTKVKDFDSLAQLTTDKIQDHLENYVMSLRKRGISAIRPRVAGPELFFEMNKKLFYKKVLHKLFPSEDNPIAGNVAYTNDDINAMLSCTHKLRTKALVHFLASTGIRPGAFADPPFRIKHLKKMKDNCYAIKVYDQSKEGYWAFLTPEAVEALNRYLDSRKINGEALIPESYLFKTYNMRTKKSDYLSYDDVSSILKNLIKKSGIAREKVNARHYDKAQSYGFRKRFNTILKINNDVNSNIAEKLMAHKRGLDGRYLTPTLEECFDEFRKAIPDILVDEKQRQKLKIRRQEEEIDQLKQAQQETLEAKQLWAEERRKRVLTISKDLVRKLVKKEMESYKKKMGL